MTVRCFLVACVLVLSAPSLEAQGYRIRLDTRYQSVAYRGVSEDSIAVTDVVVGAQGGFETPDGFAVRCVTGRTFCSYFRPGPEQRGGPLVTTADVHMWGMGVRGLRFRGRARIGADLGDSNVWPGNDPAVQLLDGHAEYSNALITAQLGRTYAITRLGFTGFDGTKIDVRPFGERVTASVYGGWGLARGVAMPLTSSALNPLDDAQPRRRQAVAGAILGWSATPVQGRLVFEREWAPGSNATLAERAGADIEIRWPHGVSVNVGAEYDLAAGFWGSADASLTYVVPRSLGLITMGVRRYRPHFDLWTIWGAFSPVPYRSAFARLHVTPVSPWTFRARGEVYAFDETLAESPFAKLESNGWRWSAGSTVSLAHDWTVAADYHREFGPGAASQGIEGSVAVLPTRGLSLTLQGGIVERPLEFRYSDAEVWTVGLAATFKPSDDLRLYGNLHRYDEVRNRPDAAAFDWKQLRVMIGATIAFGSRASSGVLPPSILRIPMRRVER